jgi:hypothetical protein
MKDREEKIIDRSDLLLIARRPTSSYYTAAQGVTTD